MSEIPSNESQLVRELVTDLREERRLRRLTRSIIGVALACSLTLGLATAARVSGLFSQDPADVPHTAVVQITGELAAGAAADADLIAPAIERAMSNANARALVLRINSPGGSPVQAGRIYDAIERAQAAHPGKPVIAVIDEIGASGGYYVAAAADTIYADPASLVGSIGVISPGWDLTGLMDKLGVKRRALTAGESKALLDPFQEMSVEHVAFWQTVLDTTHQQFISRVREGRGQRLKDDTSLFTGLIWSGEQARALGLIDGFGSLATVARDVVGEKQVVDYTPRTGFARLLANQVAAQVQGLATSAAADVRIY